jgi:hypothetical protein
MLDSNILSDYSKVGAVFKIGNDEMGRYHILEGLVNDGYIDFSLTRIFNLRKTFTEEDFLSLLFYMGMLTLREVGMAGWRCEIPNYVIKKLYFEYFIQMYFEKIRFSVPKRDVSKTVVELVGNGNPEPFFKIIEEVLREHHSNRDEMSYGEKHLQTLMVGLLYPYESYMIHSEYEARRGYPDIFLERIHDKRINYEIVLELKYATKSEAKTITKKIAAAKTQLDGYMTSARFARPNIRGFYVAYVGGELHEWKEWGKY